MKRIYHFDGQKMVEGPAPCKARPNLTIIPDIKPYRAIAGDMADKWILGRKQHREYLRRNHLEEVGNEKDYFFRYGGRTEDNRN